MNKLTIAIGFLLFSILVALVVVDLLPGPFLLLCYEMIHQTYSTSNSINPTPIFILGAFCVSLSLYLRNKRKKNEHTPKTTLNKIALAKTV